MIADLGKEQMAHYLRKHLGLILFGIACIACIAAIIVALTHSKKEKSDHNETAPGATAPGATAPGDTDNSTEESRHRKRADMPADASLDASLTGLAEPGVPKSKHTAREKTSAMSLERPSPLVFNPIEPDFRPAAPLVFKPVAPAVFTPAAPPDAPPDAPPVFMPAASPVFKPLPVFKPIEQVSTPPAPPVSKPVAPPVLKLPPAAPPVPFTPRPSKDTVPSPFMASPLLPGPSASVLTPSRKVSRYIFTDGTKNHRASWETHIMHGHMRYHPGTLIWDIGQEAEHRGVIIGRNTGWGEAYPTWLIWREKHAKSFKNLHYWQNAASGTYMAAIYMLWGTNRISTDDKPSEENGWTRIGYFRVGKVGPKGKDQQVGHYVAPQMNEKREEMNDGTKTTPLTQEAFGIWGITPVYLAWKENAHGVFISRLSINEPADESLNDFETTVLQPGQTLEYV